MQIKNSPWLVGAVVLVATLAYVKWEMARNRRMISEEVNRSVAETPGRIASNAISSVARLLTTNTSPPDAQQNQKQDMFGGLLNLATSTVQRATQVLSSNAPPGGTSSEATQRQDAVGAVLDLAAKTARSVDDAGLRMTEMSDEEEIKFGAQLDRNVLREMPEASDPATVARLESLARPLIDQCKRKQIQYKIRVVKSSKVNAFGGAGGYIYFTTAFIKRFPTDEELAMTLGHEVSHIELKNAVHKVQYLYRGRKIVGDFAQIGQAGYSVLSAPYTKEQEYEADSLGFDFCRKAGWQAAKLLTLYDGLIKLEQEQKQKGSAGTSESGSDLERRLGDYWGSHPSTAERLARLKARSSG